MFKKIVITFIGFWMVLACVGCATESDPTPNPDEDKTEEKNEFTVTFDSLGGTSIEAIKVEEGSEIKLPTAPTRDGFTFEGWFTDKECTKPFTDLKVSSNLTVYAKWKKIEVSVPLAATKVFMIGDSTCAYYDQSTKDLDYYYQRAGFGSSVSSYLKEEAEVVNLAVGGASSRSFATLEEYKTFTSSVSEGDYVIIAFGHNDEKKIDEKFATLEGNSKDKEGTFHYYLYHNFIKVALAAGATPILATPIVRYDASGAYAEGTKYLHVMQEDASYGGGDYAEATRTLAASEKLTLIDNTRLTAAKWRTSTPKEAMDYYGMITSTAIDGTHLNSYGAQMVGYMMAAALKDTDSKLAAYVKADITEPTKEEYLVVNPQYVEPSYEAPTTWSTLWGTKEEDWHASAFGYFKKDPKNKFTEYFDIKENQDNTVTLSDKTDTQCGRFNSKGDGLLMYFRQLRVDDDFTIEATMHVDEVKVANSGSGCGLMVRDDMYIDQYVAELNTNFLAVGALGMPFTSGESKYTYVAFQREKTEALTRDKKDKSDTYLQAGDQVTLKIVKIDSTYSLYYNGNKTGVNYDLSLAGDDKEFIYVGLFVAGVTCTFSNITFTTN